MPVQLNVFSGRVVFDHLPKTAGQAVNAWFADALGRDSVTPNLVGGHRDLIRRYGGEYCIVSGHLVFEPGEALDPRYRYVTLLREPVDRALSWLHYLCNDVSLTTTTKSLIEEAAAFLASHGNELGHELSETLRNPYVTHFAARTLDTSHQVVDADRLAAAERAIAEYDVVGCYEHMPHFLAEVGALVGVSAPSSLGVVNATSKRVRVDDTSAPLRARIAELNGLDLALYRGVHDRQAVRMATGPRAAGWRSERDGPFVKYERQAARDLRCEALEILTCGPRQGYNVVYGQFVEFDIEFTLARPIADLECGIHIKDSDGRLVFGSNTTLQGLGGRPVGPGHYRATHTLVAELPIGPLSTGFMFAERSEASSVTLAWSDVACRFEVHRPSASPTVGASCAPIVTTLDFVAPVSSNGPVIDFVGYACIVDGTLPEVRPGEVFDTVIEVRNGTDQPWHTASTRRIWLTSSWYDEGRRWIADDAECVELAADGVEPGQTRRFGLRARAPRAAGRYLLIPTLMQDRVGRFDRIGDRFESVPCDVDVRSEVTVNS